MKELPVLQPTYAPVRTLMLYLTEDCNLRCTYCFVKKSPRAMSLETARQAVDFYLHRNISGNLRDLNLTFFGGEPFLALDTMEAVVEHAAEAGRKAGKRVRFGATTNATFATPRVERLVRESRIHLLVSIDGGEEAMRQRPYLGGGSPYKAVARNLKRLVEWAPALTARMTYHPEALDLVANVERVLDLGAPAITLSPVVESDWRGYEERLEEAYSELADWFIREARSGRYVRLLGTWEMLRKTHAHTQGAARQTRPCPVGTSLVAVDPEGNLMPCHRYLYRPQDWFGRIDQPHFPPEREKYVRLSTRALLGCDDCSANPVCGGGCRLVVVSERLDLETGIHPGHCLNTRAHARAVYRIYNTLMEEQPASFTQALHRDLSVPEAFGELTL